MPEPLALNAVDPKDPSEIAFYTMDWTALLNSGATISTSAWTINPAGLTNVADSIVTGNLKTTIKVSGGVADTDYEATNTVTASDGETRVRTGVIKVRKR
jgi:hypothetical protein